MSRSDDYQFDAFVSYSRRDRVAVEKLVERLRADGFRLWVDEEQIGGGDPLREAMVTGILQSRHVLVCLSPAYLGSKWGTFESAVNQALDPDNRQRRLIPVRIAAVTIPAEYRWLYCPDLTNPVVWEAEYQKATKHIRLHERQQGPPRQDRPDDEPNSTSPESTRQQEPALPPPSRGLKALGFRFDPFAFPEAEKMPLDALQATLVSHPGFDEYVMDLGKSAVLLAKRGAGKTACRRQLEASLEQRRQRGNAHQLQESDLPHQPLAVVYEDFGGVVGHLPSFGLQEHANPLLAAAAKAVFDLIINEPDRFVELSDGVRDWWLRFLVSYLAGVSLEDRVRQSPLDVDWQRFDVRTSPFSPGSTLLSILKDVQVQCSALGIDSLFVLVDGVDGYLATHSLPNLEALVAPLLNALQLLSLSGLVWKFFLPASLERVVFKSTGYKTGRLEVVPIQWDERSLMDFLRGRLEWASDGFVRDIAQICDQELLRTVSVEEELVEMALRHNRLGPPRALLEMGRRLAGYVG